MKFKNIFINGLKKSKAVKNYTILAIEKKITIVNCIDQ